MFARSGGDGITGRVLAGTLEESVFGKSRLGDVEFSSDVVSSDCEESEPVSEELLLEEELDEESSDAVEGNDFCSGTDDGNDVVFDGLSADWFAVTGGTEVDTGGTGITDKGTEVGTFAGSGTGISERFGGSQTTTA